LELSRRGGACGGEEEDGSDKKQKMGDVGRPKRSVGALIYRVARMSKTDIESISDEARHGSK
jgi:hypothetical protein